MGSVPGRDFGFRQGRIRGRFGSHLPGAHQLPTGPSTRRPEPGPGLGASAGFGAPAERLQAGARVGAARGAEGIPGGKRIAAERVIFHAGGARGFLQPPRRAHAYTWWVLDGAEAGKSLELLPSGLRAGVRHRSPRRQLGIQSCCDHQVWEIPKVC